MDTTKSDVAKADAVKPIAEPGTAKSDAATSIRSIIRTLLPPLVCPRCHEEIDYECHYDGTRICLDCWNGLRSCDNCHLCAGEYRHGLTKMYCPDCHKQDGVHKK